MPSSAVYPGSWVVSRAMCYGVYISEIHYARIYAAIYRYACIYRINGTLMDLSSELKLIFVGKTFIS